MKYLRTYEAEVRYNKYVDLYQLKKYFITQEFDSEYFFDEKIEIDEIGLKIKALFFYNSDSDELFDVGDTDYADFILEDDLLFDSDNYDEAKNYFDNIVGVYRDAKKYNL